MPDSPAWATAQLPGETYNKDGRPDVVVTGSTGGNGKVSRIYRNNGNGSFTDISAGLTALSYSAAAWGDYDSDGWLDLAIAGCYQRGHQQQPAALHRFQHRALPQ